MSPKNLRRRRYQTGTYGVPPGSVAARFLHQPAGFDLQQELKRICGVDLTRIEGVKLITVQTLLSEVGADLSSFATENHFVSWLGLAPKRQISGGKLIRHERSRNKNRAAAALRMAASTLERSQSYLGARFRSFKARLDPGRGDQSIAGHKSSRNAASIESGLWWNG